MDRTGQTLLGKYKLTRLLGRGGMGEVWEGQHAVTGRRVAVKVLSEKYLENRKVVKRFGREARAASAVSHPGIVEILDQDRTPEGVPFLVMEFLEGESLGERLRGKGRLSQDEALRVMLPLLDALGAAHGHGVIHRDLKPDNVYLLPGSRGQESIKILDFGISRKADEIEHKLTQEGSVLGTPHYMSPEQARGELGIDARADLYAVGVLMYELVVGDVPFDAGNYNALLQIILTEEPMPPRMRGAQITRPVEQVLLAALCKDRQGRPPDARAFREQLERASAQPDEPGRSFARGTFHVPTTPPAPAAAAEDEPADPFAPSASESRRSPSPPLDAASSELWAGAFAERGSALHSEHDPSPPDPFRPSTPQAVPPSSASLDWMSDAGSEALQLDLDASRSSARADASSRSSIRNRGASAHEPSKRPRSARRHHGQNGSLRALRVALRWLLAAAVIAGLLFFVRKLFERDDPRRRRSDEAAAPDR